MDIDSILEGSNPVSNTSRSRADLQNQRSNTEGLQRSLRLLSGNESRAAAYNNSNPSSNTFHQLQLSQTGGQMGIQEMIQLFQKVAMALRETEPDSRVMLLNAMSDLPICPAWPRVEAAFHVLLPQLVQCLSDDVVAVRREATQCLHLLLKHTFDFSTVMKSVIKHGLETPNKDAATLQKDCCSALNIVLTPDLADNDFHDLIHVLVKRTVSVDKALCSAAQTVLLTIRRLIGDEMFEEELKTLAAPLQKYYLSLSGGSPPAPPSTAISSRRASREQVQPGDLTPKGSTSSRNPPPAPTSEEVSEEESLSSSPPPPNTNHSQQPFSKNPNSHFPIAPLKPYGDSDLVTNSTLPDTSGESLLCGFIPTRILRKLRESTAAKEKYAAIEEFRALYYALPEKRRNLLPYVHEFLSVCQLLLQEANFNIANVTLEVLCDFVECLHKNLHLHCHTLVHLLANSLEDNKAMVQQSAMRYGMLLVKHFDGQAVLMQLCEGLSAPGRRARSKQNVVDIVIAALLTFPSVDFELDELCKAIAPALVDKKQQVRVAGLECVALLAHLLGPGRLGPLVVAVDHVEIKSGEEGVMEAVQSRISRHQIPRLDSQGLVEYAGNARLMNGSASSSSAGSTTSSRRGAPPTPAKDEVNNTPLTSSRGRSMEDTLEKRRPSAGKARGRARLPWDTAASTSTNNADSDYEKTVSSRSTVEMKSNSTPKRTDKDVGSNNEGNPNSVWVSSGPSENLMTIRDLKAIPLKSALKPAKKIHSNSSPHLSSTETGHPGAAPDNNNTTNVFHKATPPTVSRPDDTFQRRGPLTKTSPLMPIPSKNDNADEKEPNSRHVEQKKIADLRSMEPPRRSSVGILPNSKEAGRRAAEMETTSIEPLRQSMSVPHAISSADSALETRNMRRASSNNSRQWGLNDLGLEDVDTSTFTSTNTSRQGLREASTLIDSGYEAPSRGTSRTPLRTGASPTPPLPLDTERFSEFDLNSTLSSIRSSASHKRALKLFQDAENKSNAAKSMPPKAPSPQRDRRGNQQASNQNPQQYNPYSGATFKENRNYEGLVIGRRFSEDIVGGTPEGDNTGRDLGSTNKPTASDKKKTPIKGNHSIQSTDLLATNTRREDVGAVNQGNNMWTPNDNNAGRHSPNITPTTEDGFNIIGKGIGEGTERKQPPNRRSNASPKNTTSSNASGTPTSLNAGVVGRGVADKTPDSEEMELNLMSITMKRRIKQAEQEQRTDMATLPKRHSPPQNYTVPAVMLDDVSTARTGKSQPPKGSYSVPSERKEQPGKPPIGPTTPSTPKHLPSSPKASPLHKWASAENVNPYAGAATGAVNPEQLPLDPLPKPEKGLADALSRLSQADWQEKICGLNLTQRLCKHHAQEHLARSTELHALCLAVAQECKNLRSQVSRMALNTFEMMFEHLGKAMDAELENSAKVILQKAGESSGFIREDAEAALVAMAANTTHQKSLNALIQGGASHKNSAIRRTCAMVMCSLCESMDAGRILSGVKDITDKILPCAAQFAIDANPETRYYGRKIFYGLLHHTEFEKMCNKHIPANVWRSVKDIVENLRSKGLGEPPSSTPSANLRRSVSLNRDVSAGAAPQGGAMRNTDVGDETMDYINTAPNLGETLDSVGGRSRSKTRKPKVGGSSVPRQDQLDVVNNVCVLLSSTDWRERLQGLDELTQMAEDMPEVFTTHIVKICDKFLPRLSDPNSKVNLQALQVLEQILPLMSSTALSQLQPVLPTLVQKTSANLSSKNAEVSSLATHLLDLFIEFLDGTLVTPALTQACSGANTQTRPVLLLKLAMLCERLDARRTRLISLHVLPELWRVLQILSRGGSAMGGGQALKHATSQLVHVLMDTFGANELLDAARQQASNSVKLTQMLEEIMDNMNSDS